MTFVTIVVYDKLKGDRPVLVQPVESSGEIPRVLTIIKRTTAPEILVDYKPFAILVHHGVIDDNTGLYIPDEVSVNALSFDTLDFVNPYPSKE